MGMLSGCVQPYYSRQGRPGGNSNLLAAALPGFQLPEELPEENGEGLLKNSAELRRIVLDFRGKQDIFPHRNGSSPAFGSHFEWLVPQ